MTVWRLVSQVSSLVGTRVAGAGFGLLSQLVLARNFSRDDVGIAFLAMSSAAFVSLLMTGGYPALAITYLARYHTLGRETLVRAFHAAARRDSLGYSLVILAAIAAGLFLVPALAELRMAMAFGCLAAVPYALMRLNNSAANALKRFMLSYVPDFMFRPGLLLLFIAGSILLWPGFAISHVLWGFAAVTALVAGAQAWLIGEDGVTAGAFAYRRRSLARYLRGRAAALVIVALVTVAYADIVTLAAGLFMSPADVAVAGVAIRLAALAGFVTQATQQFVMRDLTAELARGTSETFNRLLLRTNLIALAVMVAALLGAAVLGDFALGLFGGGYTQGYWALLVFVLGQTLRALSGMNAHLLSLGGFQVRTAFACAGSVAVLIAAMAILAPRFGVTGAALAAFAAEAVWAACLAFLAHTLTGRRGDLFAAISARKRG